MADLSEETKKRLGDQLIKLGDMMGDGLHLERDGKWIARDYKRIARALGYLPPAKRVNRSETINAYMIKRTAEVPCQSCNGKLKQTRSGSKRGVCQKCGKLWQLLK